MIIRKGARKALKYTAYIKESPITGGSSIVGYTCIYCIKLTEQEELQTKPESDCHILATGPDNILSGPKYCRSTGRLLRHNATASHMVYIVHVVETWSTRGSRLSRGQHITCGQNITRGLHFIRGLHITQSNIFHVVYILYCMRSTYHMGSKYYTWPTFYTWSTYYIK